MRDWNDIWPPIVFWGMVIAIIALGGLLSEGHKKIDRLETELATYPTPNKQEQEYLAREKRVAARQFNSLDVEKKIIYQRAAMIEYLRGLAQLKAIKEAK